MWFSRSWFSPRWFNRWFGAAPSHQRIDLLVFVEWRARYSVSPAALASSPLAFSGLSITAGQVTGASSPVAMTAVAEYTGTAASTSETAAAVDSRPLQDIDND